MNIPLLDAEWRLIESVLTAQMKLQAQLNAYVSIIQARAGDPEVNYNLDPINKQLVPK